MTPEREVKLISEDGEEFVIPESVAKVSKTLKAMLESNFIEGQSGTIKLSTIKGRVLARVVAYLQYNVKFALEEDLSKIPQFEIGDDMAIDLALAANYLDC